MLVSGPRKIHKPIASRTSAMTFSKPCSDLAATRPANIGECFRTSSAVMLCHLNSELLTWYLGNLSAFWACWARCDRVIAGIGSRVHGRIGCLRLAGEKSGQVLVRTLEGENPSQMRLGCKSRTGTSHWSRGRCERHPDGRLKKRTGFGSHPGERKPKPDAAGMQVAHGDFSLESREMRAASRRRLKKRTGFGSHPGE